MIPQKLPEFKGYTVDVRLREFRKLGHGEMEFISFDTTEGDLLLAEYIDTLTPQQVMDLQVS